MPLSEQELRTLSNISETLVPRTETHGLDPSQKKFYERSASDLGVDKALADIIETKLEPRLREQFQRLFAIFESRPYNMILSGKPMKFSDLEGVERRTEYLKGWRDSKMPAKRQAFQALKRLVCFLFYSITDDQATNPNWEDIGYPGPREKIPLGHPENLRIAPLDGSKSNLDCEVCIVGSGAGGSVIAYELSKAGYDVLVVEAGEYGTSETFNQGELDMMSKLFDNYGTAATSDLSFVLLSGKGAGGGTTVNWMTSIKPPSGKLLEWESEYGIGGLTEPEFQGYVDEIWNLLKVNLNESARNGNNEVLWRGCKSLGYKEGQDYEPIWRNAVGCENRCAFCTYGCVYSCKQSTLLNYLPMAFKNGTRFLFSTKIERVIVEGGVAKELEGTFTSKEGKKSPVTIGAKVFVLACGSIKTPALLLNSGIGNENVGRNLRLHPTTAVSGLFKEEIRAWDGPPQTVVVTKYLDSDGPRHGFWIEAAPAHPGLFAMSSPWMDGKAHKDYMKKWFNFSSASIVLLKEWGSGRVSVDKHGSSIVSYKLGEKDKKNMSRGMKETARILAAAGARGLSSLHSEGLDVVSKDGVSSLTQNELDKFCNGIDEKGIAPNKILLFSAHLMGSCRMSSDESLGAANSEGELYGVRNLFIGDASVFPTTLGANPMITIMAMSKRTSGFIAKRLSETI